MLINDYIYEFGNDFFTGEIDSLVTALQEIKKLYPNYKDHYIKIDYYGYDGGHNYSLYGMREETKQEKEKRVSIERSRKEKKEKQIKDQEEKERALFEKLKEKYGTHN